MVQRSESQDAALAAHEVLIALMTRLYRLGHLSDTDVRAVVENAINEASGRGERGAADFIARTYR